MIPENRNYSIRSMEASKNSKERFKFGSLPINDITGKNDEIGFKRVDRIYKTGYEHSVVSPRAYMSIAELRNLIPIE